MAYLIDTSIIVRLADSNDPLHATAMSATFLLRRQGEDVHITAQNLIEFRNAATRPSAVNGLGLTSLEALKQAANFESFFSLLPETPDIYPAWKQLVTHGDVIGKQVHDARLVAVCQVYSISHLLTFNLAHFTRLASLVPGLTIVHPATITGAP